MTAPEELLLELAGGDEQVTRMVLEMGPLMVPFDSLADLDGWEIDPHSREPGAIFDDPTLDTDQRIANALLVALDYAVRRGADDVQDALEILGRETPIKIVEPVDATKDLFAFVERIGLIGRANPFARRARGHELAGGIRSDPALSFQPRSTDNEIGNNALSSFIVHVEGEMNQVSVTGDPSERWGVEIGLSPTVGIERLPEIEAEIAGMPSYLDGVSSTLEDDGLVVGWAGNARPDPHDIGCVIRAWTMALFDIDLVDVRIVFAPARGRSAVLTNMRARAKAYRLYRDAVISGHPDPEQVVAEYQQTNREVG